MTEVVGLFSNGAEATKAVDALSTLDIGDGDFRTIEGPLDPERLLGAVPVPPSGSVRGGVIAWPEWDALDIDDEAADFFRRSVADGAVLVVAEVDDERVTIVRQVFEEHDARIATG